MGGDGELSTERESERGGERACVCVRVCKLAVRVAVFGLPLVVCCFAYLTFTPSTEGPRPHAVTT